jgi:hypothetical protein
MSASASHKGAVMGFSPDPSHDPVSTLSRRFGGRKAFGIAGRFPSTHDPREGFRTVQGVLFAFVLTRA